MTRFEPYYDQVGKVLDTLDQTELQPEMWQEVATQVEQDKDNSDTTCLIQIMPSLIQITCQKIMKKGIIRPKIVLKHFL
ncbi:hypothetical protein MAR_021407 [Mya arenaria]|uniref:Uncharacterized protein n=1 Tax=Mya arenaria TaxID=6604 RepID=A0ABY7EBD3_MYAAR|nr:hypothetical protein MAR_021407 [Mya arenaria]